MQVPTSVKIKRWIRCSLGKVLGVNYSKVERKISRAEIISFDIFDTLVKRKVKKPEDVHGLVYQEFLRRTGIDVREYQKRRVTAEREARRNKSTEEITLKDIFHYMSGISENDRNALRKLEEEMELSVCYPNPGMRAVYKKALKQGKRIIITSDMYLDEKIIKQILHRCGYDNYEKLYLSSSFNMCKSTGSIYEVIRRDYAGFQGRILHIGDNVKSDYVIPKIKRVNALLISGE